jgi:hypothetical protein
VIELVLQINRPNLLIIRDVPRQVEILSKAGKESNLTQVAKAVGQMDGVPTAPPSEPSLPSPDIRLSGLTGLGTRRFQGGLVIL